MKILLYTEGYKKINKSGLGKSIEHQMKALDSVGIEYTLDSKSEDYDILHINTYYIKSYFLAKKAKRHGKKVVYHAHSTEEDFKNSFIFSGKVSLQFKKWLIKCYRMGDTIITPTLYSKKLLQSYDGLKDKRIYNVSNGIDISFFERDAKLGKEFRKKYNFSRKDKVIFGTGLYIERKGILDFVKLAKRLPEYKFIWFGYSPLALSPQAVRDAVNTKLPNLYFPGYVERDIIKGAMSGADLYLMPTLEETEGIPIIEACACKQNAIIRDIPVFDGWLTDKVNVYKAKDIDEFEILIKKFFNKELPSLVNEAYKVAKERDLTTIGKKLKSIYEELLKEE